MTRKTAAILGASFILLVSGCAAMRAAASRRASIARSLTNLSLLASPEEVLGVARLVLVEKGFAPRDVGAGVIETDWKHSSRSDKDSSTSATWRYVVTAMSMGEGTKLTAVMNTTKTRSGSSGYSSTPENQRDFDLELEIVRRIDPGAAARIDVEAAHAAEAARQS